MLRLTALAVLAVLLAPALAAAQNEDQVTLKLDRYAELLAQAQRRSGVRPAWSEGRVRVTLPGEGERFASVTIEARVTAVGDDGDVVLLPGDVALEEVTLDGNAAPVLSVGGAHAVPMTGDETKAVVIRFVVPISDSDGRQALVPLPGLPAAELTVEGAENVDVAPAANVTRQGTSLTARLAATHAVALRWGLGATAHAVRRRDYVMSVDESGDGIDVVATIEAELGAERGEIRIAQSSAALVDVREGALPITPRVVDEWHVASLRGRGRKTITARFRLAIDRAEGQPQVVLHPDESPITRVELGVPGARTVQIEPAVPIVVRTTGQGDRGATRAVAHLPPVPEVTVQWTESRNAPEQLVRANTETYQLVTLQEGVLRSRVIVRYELIRGKLRELPIELPDDVVPYKVTGDAVADWRTFAPTGDEPRQVRVTLARELEGTFGIELQLEGVAPRQEGAPVGIPVVRPLGAFREGGVVALFDGDKVGFAEAAAQGYTKVGQDALPPDVRQTLTDKVAQAFKHIGEPGTITSKVATARTREVRFDAHVDSLYLLRDGALTGHATVLVEIKSGRRDALMLSLPEGVAEPRITAPSLNKVEAAQGAGEGRRGYDVRFTQALEGAVQIDVEFEMLLPKDLGRVRVPDVRVHGAEVEEGFLGITAETGMEVQTAEVKDLRTLTVEELPRAVRLRSEREIVLGFGYTHAPWTLDVDVKRHRTVETLNAVITGAWIETHVLDSGHLITRASLQVTNEDRQFLQLALPEGSRVLTISAGGTGVKAVADEKGAIKVPLSRGTKQLVDVVYEVTRDRLGFFGSLDLAPPKPDLRVSGLQWLVRFPDRYSLYGLDTDLKEQPSYFFRPIDRPEPAVPFALPVGESFDDRLFTYAVLDPAEATPGIDVMYAAGSSSTLDGLMFAAAIALLAVFVWRRSRGVALDRVLWGVLAVGLLLLLLKTASWSLSAGEAVAAVVLLVVVAFVGRRSARGAARSEPPAPPESPEPPEEAV